MQTRSDLWLDRRVQLTGNPSRTVASRERLNNGLRGDEALSCGPAAPLPLHVVVTDPLPSTTRR